jgi:2-dehydro-3-deoxygluconokinase
MSVLALRHPTECRYDLVSLGEVMLRLDPGEVRIHTTRHFDVWEGGGEYNVARGLRRCFGLRTGIVTALADNSVGRLVEDLILTGGVTPVQLHWAQYDGLGRSVRNGLNFTERGFGVRGALGVSDRGHTAVSQLKRGDIDWEDLFGNQGVRWFHTGGIFAGLSDTTPEVVEEAVRVAKRHGTIVSYDLNYRPSLWKSYGGQARAQEVNRALAPHIDVMIGNEEDFTAALGFEIPDGDPHLRSLDPSNFQRMIELVTAEFTNIAVVATTLRGVRTATVNDWSAVAWSALTGFVQSVDREGLEIFDRVGGGDSFASGLIYGLLTDKDLAESLEYGAAHGALAMTTPGDTSMALLSEVAALAAGGGARVQR